MTIFAIICASFYPVVHLGRAYLSYTIFPYPNTRMLDVNFYSPLVWDFFAIGTYFTVSLLFWFIGLIPDLAILKNKVKSKFLRNIYTLASSRWNGSHHQWSQYFYIFKIIACVATALVVSVHTIVSLDFAVSEVAGWHSPIFPLFFVIGAVFAGFAMVQIMLIFIRNMFGFRNEITINHIDNINRVILINSILMFLCYFSEVFVGYFSNQHHEINLLNERLFGSQSFEFYSMFICNVLLPQLLWIKKIRKSEFLSVLVAIFICIGMWLERYVIVIGSLQTSSITNTDSYSVSNSDIGLFVGTLGVFMFLFLLFIKMLPALSINELLTNHIIFGI